jgi:hypothetical protein
MNIELITVMRSIFIMAVAASGRSNEAGLLPLELLFLVTVRVAAKTSRTFVGNATNVYIYIYICAFIVMSTFWDMQDIERSVIVDNVSIKSSSSSSSSDISASYIEGAT